MKKYTLWLIISTSLLLLMMSAFLWLWHQYPLVPKHELLPIKQHAFKKHELRSKDFTSSATLTAVGDILIHSLIYNAAKTGTGYDFNSMFSEVRAYLERADLTFANQETMIGGVELGLSTYPRFNSPYEVATALKANGIDIVSIANNHSFDRGEKAIQNATAFYQKLGLLYTGAYQSEEDSQIIRTINKNGITFSFLAYTYGTNGIPLPKDKPYLVNQLELSRIAQDVKQAKQISDVVVVSLHFGNEYERMPNQEQKYIVKQVVNEGADIILGHHPHVLQPMEWVKAENGHKGFVVYSLGNFLSGQKSIYREIGGILTLTINKEIKDGQTTISIDQPSFVSTYVSKTHGYKIVPLEKASQFGLSAATALDQDITEHMYQLLPNHQLAQAN